MQSKDYEVIDGCFIQYVNKEELFPYFGEARRLEGFIRIRNDLSPRVKNFVKQHELYHCSDNSNWGGWIGREIRANFFPGIRDPMGLIFTIVASMNKERMKLYYKKFRKQLFG